MVEKKKREQCWVMRVCQCRFDRPVSLLCFMVIVLHPIIPSFHLDSLSSFHILLPTLVRARKLCNTHQTRQLNGALMFDYRHYSSALQFGIEKRHASVFASTNLTVYNGFVGVCFCSLFNLNDCNVLCIQISCVLYDNGIVFNWKDSFFVCAIIWNLLAHNILFIFLIANIIQLCAVFVFLLLIFRFISSSHILWLNIIINIIELFNRNNFSLA